jgi:hypothetical protein
VFCFGLICVLVLNGVSFGFGLICVLFWSGFELCFVCFVCFFPHSLFHLGERFSG